MIALLLMLSVAVADDDVVFVPQGSTVTAAVPSYLLPDPMFSKCLSDAKTLRDLTAPGLEQCQSVCSSALRNANEALETCRGQFDLDQDRIADLLGHVAGLKAQATKLRQQRTVAWAIAGSLLAGSVTAIVVATK
jgi:hypothetical protein